MATTTSPAPPGAAPPGGRTALLVLGMHRSGTSVLTDLIARLGAALPADPNPPGPDNPRGYWEPVGLVRLHDRLLFAADSAWLDPRPLDLSVLGPERLGDFAARIRAALARSFGTAPRFVVKDPRMCRMVPFYRDLLGGLGLAVRVVLALRPPADVAASLRARDQLSADYVGLLWARHMLEAERHTRDLPRIVVSYDALTADWQAAARRLAGFMGAGALDPARLDSPVEAGLHHHRGAADAFSPPLGALLHALHAALAQLPEDGTGSDRIDRLAERIEAAAERRADLVRLEFCVQRLTTPYDTLAAPDPLRERRTLAAALERLHRAGWDDGADPARPHPFPPGEP